MKPVDIKVHRKEYDDLMRRWLAEVSFEIEGHDQPYLATLVSETGQEWRSNGVHFNPVPEQESAGSEQGAQEERKTDEDDEFGSWLYTEGNVKEMDLVVELLKQRTFLAELETVLLN